MPESDATASPDSEQGRATRGDLTGRTVLIAGATNTSGRAVASALLAAGARVVVVGSDEGRIEALERELPGVVGERADLTDSDDVLELAMRVHARVGDVDGVVHLVGGWRGSASFTETDLADWDTLHNLLIRTVQHTSLAFEGALARSGNGRYLLISAAGASNPTAGNAAYSASKAAAEAWTLALGDAFRKAGGDAGPAAAAAILVVKALVNDQMRAERPKAKFSGFTDVKDLADTIAGTWSKPTEELNGTRLWLTPKP